MTHIYPPIKFAVSLCFKSPVLRAHVFKLPKWVLQASLTMTGLAGSVCAAESNASLDHFEKKVRPLLVQHCYGCHSAEKKIKGGLRLDFKGGWQEGGDSGPAIDPHDPGKSLLLKAVSYQDRDLKMPPKNKLSDAEVAVLKEWVMNGARDPRESAPEVADAGSTGQNKEAGDSPPKAGQPAKGKARPLSASELWSFQPIVRPSPETRDVPVKDTSWPRDAVDRHILAKLEQAGLRPAKDAPLSVLGRRLYTDLTGLPPTAEQLAAFLANPDVPALVDSLLNSPQFGERWAQHWLDITRFAESSGGGRTLPFKDAWRFRDYIIESLNADTPLDQLIREHIAGDLMETQDSAVRRRNLTATAFLALGPTNYEEQDKGLLRMDIIDEQLETIGRSFMGLTIGCARCHDHKFDPISTQDYYALAGIFRSTQTLQNYSDNVAHWVDRPLPLDGPLEEVMVAKETRLVRLEADLKVAVAKVKKLRPNDETKSKGKPISADSLPGIVVDDTQAKLVGPWQVSNRSKSYVGEGYLHDDNQAKGSCSITFLPVIREAGRYEVRLAYTSLQSRDTKVPVKILHADGEETVYVDQTNAPPLDGRFISLGTYRFEKDGAGFILVSNEGTSNYVTVDAVWLLDEAALAKDQLSRDNSGDPKMKEALEVQRGLEKEIKTVKADGPTRPETMGVMDDSEPEDCAIHVRGNIRNLGRKVARGFIAGVPVKQSPNIPSSQSGRVQLAEWMTSADHPLTSRVMVNRVWMWLFGEGLVRSMDNFGATGEKPSHPLLLDHLAHDFMADGWSLKKLVKRLVLTRAYQMASLPEMDDAMTACAQADPENRLLWRAHRRRQDAHAIRDAILLLSGKLDTTMLGPNVLADSVDPNSGGAQNLEYAYVFSDTRRSVYTPAFRNKRLELFEAFDFADINQPTGQRTRSTIAPQALYFLNHPFVLEQSEAAAEKLLGIHGLADDEARIDWLWQSALGRDATERERQLARDFVRVSGSDDEGGSEGAENSRGVVERWAGLVQSVWSTADFRHLE